MRPSFQGSPVPTRWMEGRKERLFIWVILLPCSEEELSSQVTRAAKQTHTHAQKKQECYKGDRMRARKSLNSFYV